MLSTLPREENSRELSIQTASVRRNSGADAAKKFNDRRHHVEGEPKMSRNRSNTAIANIPAPLRPARLRAGLVLAVIAAMAAFAIRVQAEQMPTLATLSMSAVDSGK
jgi:hypothetical protein